VVAVYGQKDETVLGIWGRRNNSGRGYIFCTKVPITTTHPTPSTEFTLNIYVIDGTPTSTTDNPSNEPTLSTMSPIINGVW